MQDEPVIDLLLVDDSLEQHLLIKLILKDLPVQILEAYNGLEALEIFINQEVDLIIMDIEMPELTGVETIRMIRENEIAKGKKRTPAMALSGNTEIEDKTLAFQAGFDVYMEKPFLRSVFINEIQELMKKINS